MSRSFRRIRTNHSASPKSKAAVLPVVLYKSVGPGHLKLLRILIVFVNLDCVQVMTIWFC